MRMRRKSSVAAQRCKRVALGEKFGVGLVLLSSGLMLVLLVVRPLVGLHFAGQLPRVLARQLPGVGGWGERAFLGEALVRVLPLVAGFTFVSLLFSLVLLVRSGQAPRSEASSAWLANNAADGLTDRRGVLQLAGVAGAGLAIGVLSGRFLGRSTGYGLFSEVGLGEREALSRWADSAAAEVRIEPLTPARRQVIREGVRDDAVLAANFEISRSSVKYDVVRYEGWILPRAAVKVAMEAM